MSVLETVLVELVVVLLIAGTVGVALSRTANIPYTTDRLTENRFSA